MHWGILGLLIVGTFCMNTQKNEKKQQLSGGTLREIKLASKTDWKEIEKTTPLFSEFYSIPTRKERFEPRKKSLMKTKVWVFLKEGDLLVHFFNYDPAMDKIEKAKVNKGKKDARVWNDDYVDMALDANNDKETYFYIAANRNGALWDSFCAAPYKVNSDWDSSAKVDIEDRADGWAATFKIPLKALGVSFGRGDILGLTFGRRKFFNKTSLQAVLPEDAIAIDYENKLKKSQMKEDSSTTPFSSFNWYSPQRKMYNAANFKEVVVGPSRNVVSNSRGCLRQNEYAWDNEFIAFVKNDSSEKKTYSAFAMQDRKKMSEAKCEAQPGELCTIRLKYNVNKSPVCFEIQEDGKNIYRSCYSPMPKLPNLKKRKEDKAWMPSLFPKTSAPKQAAGMYWPHHLDYAPGKKRNVRYYNLLGFGMEHNRSKMLDYISRHKLVPLMMWDRPGSNSYNELKYFIHDFRKRNIKCFLGPGPGITYDHERKKLFTKDGEEVNFPVIKGRVYIFHPEVRKRYISNLKEALKNAGDVIIGIYLLDEAESWMSHMVQDIVWEYKDKYPELAAEIENEVKNKYGFGKYGVPAKTDKDPFKRLALRRFISKKMLDFQLALRNAAKEIKPDILICANDDTHGFCWLGASNYKGKFDIVPHQLNNFPTMPGKCEAELKYLVDVSGCEVWPFPHIEAWADPQEANEALSEIVRVGCSGIMTYNVSGFKYSIHDAWNAPGRWEFENKLADMLAAGRRIKTPQKSDVAILMSLDSMRAFHRSVCGGAHTLVGPGTGAWYEFIDEDIIEKDPERLGKYKIIIIPFAEIIRKDAAEKLLEAAQNGATLLIQDKSFNFGLDGAPLKDQRKKLLAGGKPLKRKRLNGKENFIDAETGKKIKPNFLTGASFNCYEGEKIQPLIKDETGKIIAYSSSLGKGQVIWLGYNPFNYKDAETPDWRAFFRKIFAQKGVKMDERIWHFKLKDTFAEPPSNKGICLTGNSCRWEHNRPRLMQNMPLPVKYTYSVFPNAISDKKNTGWIRTDKGKLTDRNKRFNEVMQCVPPTKKTYGNWVAAWQNKENADIIFDLGQAWKLNKIKILFADYLPCVKISGSPDGKNYVPLLSQKAKGQLKDSLMRAYDISRQKEKFRFIKISLSKMQSITMIGEVEIWSQI